MEAIANYFKSFRETFHPFVVVFLGAITFKYCEEYYFVAEKLEKFKTFYHLFIVCNAVIQVIFWSIIAVNDYIGSNDLDPQPKPKFRKLKDNFLATVALPSALLSYFVYWLGGNNYFYTDGEKESMQKYAHVLQYMTLIYIAIEHVVAPTEYPAIRVGLKATNIFVLVHLFCILALDNLQFIDVSVYKANKRLPMIKLLKYSGVIMLVCNICFVIGKFVNFCTWGFLIRRQRKSGEINLPSEIFEIEELEIEFKSESPQLSLSNEQNREYRY